MPHGIPRRTVLAAAVATVAAAATAGPLAGAARAAAPTLPKGTSKNKVLVIGMDGLRHDRIADADAPALKSLMVDGTFGAGLLDASLAATSSGPGWSTISTGVWPDKHGVKDNSFAGKNYDTYPGFLARLDQVRPELSTYAALDWKPLDTQGTVTPGADGKNVYDGDADGYEGHDATIADEAESVIRDQHPDVLFVYFGNTDIVAHNKGVMGKAYLDAIAVQDGYTGRLLAAIKARPTYADENWTVIVTTDHGHLDGGGHGGGSTEERSVFVLARGPGIPAGATPDGIEQVDVAATVFHQLGIEPEAGWGLDGKSVAAG
ncbi:sulfatase-like hydrolase/transferase [Streptomyces sp. A7024]|uniref:Sulfatase-like hydrolase/transferase n=1 Tax=Streptomyces coryli TaxID=1128680 RepID=A0A6G4TU71_9ACTN|nr:sulfatase-like hydrolase/transferase [Streptomyces coryli]